MRYLSTAFPSIVLGDHGFLPQYGSQLTRSEIVERMRLALQHGICALAAGERFVSDAVIEAFQSENRSPIWVRHLDLPLQLDCGPIALPRAFATVCHVALEEIGPTMLADPVMGPFFDACKTAAPYTAADCQRLTLDKQAVADLTGEILSLKPQLVTLGGDVLDFIMASDRADLAITFLAAISEAAERVQVPVFLCTYLGFGWPERFAPILAQPGVDGFMLTINSQAGGMIPSRDAMLDAIAREGKPVAAMHVLLFGKIEVQEAIADVLAKPFVRTAIVGASRPENIMALCAAGGAIQSQSAG